MLFKPEENHIDPKITRHVEKTSAKGSVWMRGRPEERG